MGFGGWPEYFTAASGAALGRHSPPHNIFIAAWADAATPFAILLAVFFLPVLLGHLNLMSRTSGREPYLWGFGLSAFLLLLIHGQADAVMFYGDLRTLLLPGVLLGILIASGSSDGGPPVKGRSEGKRYECNEGEPIVVKQ